MNDNCIFCKIVKGESPSYKVFEDDKFMAFLSIFPNTEGVTVVIPKQHYNSYIFNVPENVMLELVSTAKKVANIIDSKLEDVGRTALVFEGYGVNHLHAKLFPMHGTTKEGWQEHISKVNTYFEKYEGYISTNDSNVKSPEDLEKVQKILSS